MILLKRRSKNNRFFKSGPAFIFISLFTITEGPDLYLNVSEFKSRPSNIDLRFVH